METPPSSLKKSAPNVSNNFDLFFFAALVGFGLPCLKLLLRLPQQSADMADAQIFPEHVLALFGHQVNSDCGGQ